LTLLVAIEGGDGAGKATAAATLVGLLRADGFAAQVVSFPRYPDTVGGHALGEFLSGRMPRTVSPKAAAVLYALDRLESVEHLADIAARHDVLVLDRYIASNIAYQAAKVPEAEAAAMIDWIVHLETGAFDLPPPDLNVYLDTPVEAARSLILLKQQRSYTDRDYDEHEQDQELQERVRRNYAALAGQSRLGRWVTVRTVGADSTLRAPSDIGQEIAGHVAESLRRAGPARQRRIASNA
jgi:dTMP kinase